ncbi:MAG: MBL fold metallo-hydrolase [Pseudomonadaceae bacterium]|nr:MBL fold metallo-hydrolase [Pseudomonadaceae bacterium]
MKKYFSGGVLALTLTLPLLLVYAQANNFSGGAPRGEDGRFENLVGEIGHGTLSVRVPFILRRFGTYFRSGADAPQRIANDGAFLRENAKHSSPTVTWVGHATLLVQMGHVTFLTDPTWSNRPSPVPLIGPKRYVEPGLLMDDLPPIDFVVISHNHYDHLDLPTLRQLAKRNPETVFYVPLGNGALLRDQQIDNVQELDWGQTAVHEGVTVHCLPSQHWSKRSLTDDHKALWSSWAVTAPDRRFYFAGDTGYFSEFAEIGKRLGPFDLVAVPIGAYEPQAMMRESHMNPEEALKAAIDLDADRVVAIHFGTFDLSDEPLAEPPRRFRQAAISAQIGDDSAWILNIGETREF